MKSSSHGSLQSELDLCLFLQRGKNLKQIPSLYVRQVVMLSED
jgi:hypothetical protein